MAQADVTSVCLPLRDKHDFVGAIVFLLGIGALLPWNFFLVADDFWMHRFRNVSNPETQVLTPLQLTFRSHLMVASSVPMLAMMFLNTAVSGRVNTNPRIEWPILGNTLVFLLATVGTLVDTDRYQVEFLAAVLVVVVLLNCFSGILQSGASGAVAFLPQHYMSLQAIGLSVAGVVASVAQLITLALEFNPSKTALCFFAFGTAISVCTQIGFRKLKQNAFYNYYVPSESRNVTRETARREKTIPFMQILLDGWPHYLAMFLTLFVTLLCYPTLTGLIRPLNRAPSRIFVPSVCFLTFNVADCLGRVLAYRFTLPASCRSHVLGLALARTLFIALFIWCNVAPDNRVLTKVLLPYEWNFIFIMLAFGTTNGYLIAVTMTQAPKSTSPQHQEVAGSMIIFFDGIGIFFGSMCSYLILKLL